MQWLYKSRLPRLMIGGMVFLISLLLFEIVKLDSTWAELALYIAAYLTVGGDVLCKAIRNIVRGRVFDENFLMMVATVGAFVIREYPEAAAVMIFYQIGELFQSYAVGKSRRSIKALVGIRPDYANLLKAGVCTKVSPEEVLLDDIILIKPGERVPVDGVVIEGSSTLDTSALTGESMPRDIAEGEEILSGTINGSGVLKVRVTKSFGQSTVSKILELVESASDKKSRQENFITKFARVYTPVVVLIAVLLGTIPPLIWPSPSISAAYTSWVYRALSFLVASCPCALVISIPMSFFGGIGGASKCGILIKGSGYIEALSKMETVVFDKTGTLTRGVFTVVKINPKNIKEDELLFLAAHAEFYSQHPIARSVRDAYGGALTESAVGGVCELSGRGIRASVDGRAVLAGNALLLKENNISFEPEDSDYATVVYVAADGLYAGSILIADEAKSDAKAAVAQMKRVGINRTIMLTGDREPAARYVASGLGIDEVRAELLPADKVSCLEAVLSVKRGGGTVAFVGDGINDAPSLARADIGIAMGALGSDAAIEAADIVIMTDELTKIPLMKRIAKKTVSVALQNIVFALAVKLAVLVLIVMNLANMWLAVLADVGVSIVAIINAFRALSVKKPRNNTNTAD